jgi:penicillin amidase
VRDAYGVPSVRAASDEQLWTGVGYALAQDGWYSSSCSGARPGTLAAVLGAGSLQSDVVARRDFYTRGELHRMLRRLPAELPARFDAYAAGINLWLARLRSDPSLRPLELVALGLDPASSGRT